MEVPQPIAPVQVQVEVPVRRVPDRWISKGRSFNAQAESPTGSLHLAILLHHFRSSFDKYMSCFKSQKVGNSIGCHGSILQVLRHGPSASSEEKLLSIASIPAQRPSRCRTTRWGQCWYSTGAKRWGDRQSFDISCNYGNMMEYDGIWTLCFFGCELTQNMASAMV